MWGNVNGVYSYPQSIIQNANLVPLLSMPIETNPNLRIFQYWLGYSFLPFEIAKNFSTPNDCLILVSVGNHNKNPRKQVIKNARILECNIVAYYNPPGKYSYDVKIPGKMPETPSISLLPPIWQNNASRYGELLIEIQSSEVYGKLEKVLRDMLTFRYTLRQKISRR